MPLTKQHDHSDHLKDGCDFSEIVWSDGHFVRGEKKNQKSANKDEFSEDNDDDNPCRWLDKISAGQ